MYTTVSLVSNITVFFHMELLTVIMFSGNMVTVLFGPTWMAHLFLHIGRPALNRQCPLHQVVLSRHAGMCDPDLKQQEFDINFFTQLDGEMVLDQGGQVAVLHLSTEMGLGLVQFYLIHNCYDTLYLASLSCLYFILRYHLVLES